MTNHYWERSPGALSRTMHLPWLSRSVQVPRHSAQLGAWLDGEDEDDVRQAFKLLLDSNRRLRRRLDEGSSSSL